MPAAPVVAAVLGALLVGLVAGWSAGHSSSTSSPTPTVVTVTGTPAGAAAAKPTTTAGAAPAGLRDGTYVVGTDLKPGLYKTSGQSDTSNQLPSCYWERDRDLSGAASSIIANDNVKGPTTVQISASDKAFKTSGCAPWVKIG